MNPALPSEALGEAMEEIGRDLTVFSLAEVNRAIHRLLEQGVKVSFPDQERGGKRVEMIEVIDWETSAGNDFFSTHL